VCDGLSNSCAISIQLGLAADPSIVFGDAVVVSKAVHCFAAHHLLITIVMCLELFAFTAVHCVIQLLHGCFRNPY
jgi:hypothetical protein